MCSFAALTLAVWNDPVVEVKKCADASLTSRADNVWTCAEREMFIFGLRAHLFGVGLRGSPKSSVFPESLGF